MKSSDVVVRVKRKREILQEEAPCLQNKIALRPVLKYQTAAHTLDP